MSWYNTIQDITTRYNTIYTIQPYNTHQSQARLSWLTTWRPCKMCSKHANWWTKFKHAKQRTAVGAKEFFDTSCLSQSHHHFSRFHLSDLGRNPCSPPRTRPEHLKITGIRNCSKSILAQQNVCIDVLPSHHPPEAPPSPGGSIYI